MARHRGWIPILGVTYLSPQYECKCRCLLQWASMFKTLVEIRTSVPIAYVFIGGRPTGRKENERIKKRVVFKSDNWMCLFTVGWGISCGSCLTVFFSSVCIIQSIYPVQYKHCRTHISACFRCRDQSVPMNRRRWKLSLNPEPVL